MTMHTAQNIHADARNRNLVLGGSVGRHADNNPADVITVQSRLNTLLGPPRQPLTLTGKADAAVIGAIIDFQTNVVRMRRPDGRVDVGGRTARTMSDPTAPGAWKRSAVPREAVPLSLAPQILRDEQLAPAEKLLAKEAARLGEDQSFDELRRELIDSIIPHVKKVLGTIGRSEDARTVVSAWSKLRKMGFSPKDTRRIVVSIFQMKDPGRSLRTLDQIIKPTSGFGRLLERAGRVAGTVGTVVTLIEVADKFIDGDYLYGATELYKNAMGKAIPWAALIDGVQGLVESILPTSMKSSAVFKVIRACDPLGLGASAVDSVTTCVLASIHLILRGELDSARLNRLVSRMHEGPTKLFAELGEDLGDAVYEVSRRRRGH